MGTSEGTVVTGNLIIYFNKYNSFFFFLKINTTVCAFTHVVIWADGGPHFDSHLFWIYLSIFQRQHNKKFLLNYHIAGEGKCDLDRFFGYLVALENRFVIKFGALFGM